MSHLCYGKAESDSNKMSSVWNKELRVMRKYNWLCMELCYLFWEGYHLYRQGGDFTRGESCNEFDATTPRKNLKLYLDRFFSSPTLARRLLDKQTYVCGTVMMNRSGMPKNFPTTPLEVGQMEAMQKDNMTVFAWKDKREIYIRSTVCDSTFGLTGKIDAETGDMIYKPTCVNQYNKYMGGVDLCDSIISAYPSMRKSIKWYKKVFFHMSWQPSKSS